MSRALAWLIAVVLLAALPAAAQQVYRWVDKQGVVHYTDDPEQLPEPQRSEALRNYRPPKKPQPAASRPEPARRLPRPGSRRLPPAPAPASPPDDTGVPTGEPATTTSGDRWQQFRADIGAARQQVDQYRDECRRLEQQRQATGRSALTYARPGDRQQLARLKDELEKCRGKLEQARRELERRRQAARREGAPRAVWAD